MATASMMTNVTTGSKEIAMEGVRAFLPWVYSRRLLFIMDNPNKVFIRTFLVLSILINFAAKRKKDLDRRVTYGSK